MSGLAAQAERALQSVRAIPDRIRMIGGMDEVTPPYDLKPGFARISRNFEVKTEGGYRRIAGYERVDGRPKPSDAIYSILALTITGTIAAGNTVTGGTSGATGVVVAVVAGASAYLVITKVTGTWQSGETVLVAAVSQGTTTAAAVSNGASSALLHAQYRVLAADSYRADIGAVPGEGAILGVFEYLDVKYAFRNAVGGATAALYKSSSGGWTAVALGRELSFTSGGTTEITAGQTITGAISGATAVVTRVVLQSGTWAGGTAAGRFIFASQTGTFQAENIDVGASPNLATIAGDSSAISLLPGGSYEFDIENCSGSGVAKRVYGCDGVNRGFEFDGTVFVPIATGMTTDTPSHVKVHKNQLFFSFLGSVQHSAPGTPYIWSAVVGASEISAGDTITGFADQPGTQSGGALAIYTRNRTLILYGSGVSDWDLVTYRRELGAYAKTIQEIGITMFLDDRGVTTLQTSQAYGNFQHAAITDRVRNTMNQLRTTATASCISRDKNQYRIFFSSGDALYITMSGNKVVGVMPVTFTDVVRCAWSGEMVDGSEAMYFGSDGGYVYQMDKGPSFDGDDLEAYFNLAYNFQGAPRVNKKYRDLTVEVNSSYYAAFNIGYSLGYGASDIPQPSVIATVSAFSSTIWDGFVWDAFIWDGQTLGPSSTDIDGEAENISVAIQSGTDYIEPYTISSALLFYSIRGRLRP